MFRHHKSPKKGLQVFEYVDTAKSYRNALEAEVKNMPLTRREEYLKAKETFSKLIVKSMPVFSLSNGTIADAGLSNEEIALFEESYFILTNYESELNSVLRKKGVKIPEIYSRGETKIVRSSLT